MNNLKLTKLNNPNGKKLNEMISSLKGFLDEKASFFHKRSKDT